MRDKNPSLSERLHEHPERFEFFEAARILKLLRASKPDDSTRLEFRTAPTKSFPAGEVLTLEDEGYAIRLVTQVIGLFGPAGVLPHADKDLVVGGSANILLRDFLDVFNARIIELFYEAWKLNRHDVSFEMFRRNVDKREDGFTLMLLSFCGVGLESVRNQREFPDEVFASASGLLSRNIRSASAIRRCISSQFHLPVKVNEFIQERLFLDKGIQTRLDGFFEGYNALGKTALLGERVDSHRQRFEVSLGPLSQTEFHSLCPHGNNVAFRRLVDLIKGILGRPLDFDIRFCVKSEAVSPARLGGTRLGFDSWVLADSEENDRDDPVKRTYWDSVPE